MNMLNMGKAKLIRRYVAVRSGAITPAVLFFNDARKTPGLITRYDCVVLDEAQKNGLMVTMGIEVARERHGFDYNDELAVKAQLENIKKEVLALKDHPALLIWAIGNELNLRSTNPKVWNAVNDISKMIHEVDANHLTTTTLAGISQQNINLIKERCSDLDLLSIQKYGKLEELPNQIRKFGWEGAYIVTEWGATGHWEVPKTEWGAPIEENSTLKAANYLKRYKGHMRSSAVLLQMLH